MTSLRDRKKRFEDAIHEVVGQAVFAGALSGHKKSRLSASLKKRVAEIFSVEAGQRAAVAPVPETPQKQKMVEKGLPLREHMCGRRKSWYSWEYRGLFRERRGGRRVLRYKKKIMRQLKLWGVNEKFSSGRFRQLSGQTISK